MFRLHPFGQINANLLGDFSLALDVEVVLEGFEQSDFFFKLFGHLLEVEFLNFMIVLVAFNVHEFSD